MTLYPVHVTMTSTYLWQGAMTSYLNHIMMKSTTCAVIRGTGLDDVISSSSHDDVKLLVIGGAVLEEIVSSSSHDDVKLLVIGGAVLDLSLIHI